MAIVKPSRVPKPEPRWWWPVCEERIDEEPPSERECSSEHCGITFLAHDRETDCEECRRPFTRRLREYVHDQDEGGCGEEVEELEGYPCPAPHCPEQGFHAWPDVDPATDAQIENETDEQKARALTRAAREAVKRAAWSSVLACSRPRFPITSADTAQHQAEQDLGR